MEKYYTILKELEHLLEDINNSKEAQGLKHQQSYLACAKQYNLLRKEFLHHGEISNDHEVEFFRDIKPKIHSKLIYYSVLEKFDEDVRLKDSTEQSEYYLTKLIISKSFIESNRIYESYINSKMQSQVYYHFLRSSNNAMIPSMFEFRETDPEFTTQYDVLSSMIIAHKELISHINRILIPTEDSFQQQKSISAFQWTASKVDLTELIYALHSISCFDDGSATLYNIVSLINPTIDPQEVYRNYSQIKLRPN
ncbi:MAG: hypothetical protein HOP11_07885 [Saprospiraceae bacterium]|nr:hypothetical protein [Saprospiraceae bacterium]